MGWAGSNSKDSNSSPRGLLGLWGLMLGYASSASTLATMIMRGHQLNSYSSLWSLLVGGGLTGGIFMIAASQIRSIYHAVSDLEDRRTEAIRHFGGELRCCRYTLSHKTVNPSKPKVCQPLGSINGAPNSRQASD